MGNIVPKSAANALALSDPPQNATRDEKNAAGFQQPNLGGFHPHARTPHLSLPEAFRDKGGGNVEDRHGGIRELRFGLPELEARHPQGMERFQRGRGGRLA